MNTALLLLIALGAPERNGISGRSLARMAKRSMGRRFISCLSHPLPNCLPIRQSSSRHRPTAMASFILTKSLARRCRTIRNDVSPRKFTGLFPWKLRSGLSFFLGTAALTAGRRTALSAVRIRLERPAPIEFELQSPAGDPLPLADVRFELYVRAARGGWPDDFRSFIRLPEPIAQKLECKSDDRGRLEIRFLTANDTVDLAITTPEYGQMKNAMVSSQLPGRVIRLEPAGSIEGKLTAGDAKAVKQLRVVIIYFPRRPMIR